MEGYRHQIAGYEQLVGHDGHTDSSRSQRKAVTDCNQHGVNIVCQQTDQQAQVDALEVELIPSMLIRMSTSHTQSIHTLLGFFVDHGFGKKRYDRFKQSVDVGAFFCRQFHKHCFQFCRLVLTLFGGNHSMYSIQDNVSTSNPASLTCFQPESLDSHSADSPLRDTSATHYQTCYGLFNQ